MIIRASNNGKLRARILLYLYYFNFTYTILILIYILALGLFHNINHQYGALSELCTSESCRTMNGPGEVVFHWQDDRGKRIHCSAPQYCDSAMTYCQQMVTNTAIFPTRFGT